MPFYSAMTGVLSSHGKPWYARISAGYVENAISVTTQGRLPSAVTTYAMIQFQRDGWDPATPTLEVTDMTVRVWHYAAHDLTPATSAFRAAWRSYVTSFLLVFLYTR